MNESNMYIYGRITNAALILLIGSLMYVRKWMHLTIKYKTE